MKFGKNICAGVLGLALGGQACAFAIYGLTNSNTLVMFDSAAPTSIVSTAAVSGLNAGQSLLGIDFRPVDGQLYGVSSDSRLYTINTTTGLASVIGAAGAFSLSGASLGFDFNPTVDRIRVTSDADQNLRLNPATGGLAATDTNLAYAAADPNAGANPSIVGSAYTNSFVGATLTTLFAIDALLDTLVTQIPPNAGNLNTVGALGFDTTDAVGFDILAAGNLAFASLTSPGAGSGLFSINLGTGAATSVGAIGNGLVITDIAIQQVPEPATLTLLAAALMGALMFKGRRQAV